jgi:hypothetical protein
MAFAESEEYDDSYEKHGRKILSPLANIMGAPMSFILITVIAGLLMGLVGCQGGIRESVVLTTSAKPSIPIPQDVRRIAVVYPTPSSPDMAEAYNRLESETFRLKAHRPGLKIVDRLHLPVVVREHRLQLAGSVADDSAVRIGRVLGVDTVLLYRIDGPSNRDRMWARSSRDLPPVTVTSKLIRVESAEVLYHDVVVVHMADLSSWEWWLNERVDYRRLSREALERGIMQTVSELARAFE